MWGPHLSFPIKLHTTLHADLLPLFLRYNQVDMQRHGLASHFDELALQVPCSRIIKTRYGWLAMTGHGVTVRQAWTS